jgi:threonine dehydrogenase-like Zn-dependent dehydrogenase
MNGDVPPRCRALVIAAGRRLEVIESAVPAPRPGDALVAVDGCAVGDDLLTALDGVPAGACPSGALVGAVAAAPAGARDLAPGQVVVVPGRVACGACPACRHGRAEACGQPLPLLPGALATHAWAPATGVLPLTAGLEAAAPLGWRLAAAGGPLLLAYHGLARAGLMPGDVAVFFGLDAVGLAGLQVAAADGAVPFALDDHPARLAAAAAQGAAATLSTDDLAPDEIGAAVERLAAEHGRAGARRIVVVRAGGSRALRRGVAAVPRGGTLLVLGRPPAGAALDAADLARRAALVVLVEEGHPDLLAECLALCARGAVSLAALTRPCGFDEVEAAALRLRRGDDTVVPVVRPGTGAA